MFDAHTYLPLFKEALALFEDISLGAVAFTLPVSMPSHELETFAQMLRSQTGINVERLWGTYVHTLAADDTRIPYERLGHVTPHTLRSMLMACHKAPAEHVSFMLDFALTYSALPQELTKEQIAGFDLSAMEEKYGIPADSNDKVFFRIYAPTPYSLFIVREPLMLVPDAALAFTARHAAAVTVVSGKLPHSLQHVLKLGQGALDEALLKNPHFKNMLFTFTAGRMIRFIRTGQSFQLEY